MESHSDIPMEQALQILRRVPLIDGHNDWPNFIRGYYDNRLDKRFNEDRDLAGHVDIKRLCDGKSGGVFWSAYVDCPNPENDLSDEVHLETIRDTFQQIDLIHRLIDKYSNILELVQRSTDILEIFSRGKVASMIGVEGLHQVGNSSSILRNYHRLGVRYITLTHNRNNKYSDCAKSSQIHGGLSPEGRRMVQEMNRIGLMIDLSHVSELATTETINLSQAPVAFTHSSCSALVPHPRNVSDAVLDMLNINNGIIMISFIPDLTHLDPEMSKTNHVVDHIIHVGERIGFDYIGIGSDFDGMEKAVMGLDDVSKFPNLVSCMLSRGIEKENIEKILGYNIIRVLKGVELAATRLKGLPVLEDHVKQLWNDNFKGWVKSKYPQAE
ncbi:Dipeptidase tcpJ [Lachnellula suecica]|uniref:Dipeptidase n=1 Tax=Lachnellula suecica TaxID=602035 RepID=A0A8T9CIZ0_9HELO|nr:Dipeptidase tcpJ [Lachnellula suecica]